MERRLFLGTCFSVVALGSLAKAGEKSQPVPNISLVLDCSLSMSGKFPVVDSGEEQQVGLASTKLEEAKSALKELLGDLSLSGQTKVAMWLYGHRLQWEADAAEPKMIEQQKYFEHAQGFEVLETLLPGDDVQAIRGLAPLEPKHVGAIGATLDVVEAWGEDPLYLALRQSIESLPRKGSATERRLVVITDGGNQQGMSRFRTSKDQVLEALRKHEVAVHIVYLGTAQDLPRQTASDFLQIARVGQGKVHTAKTVEELHKALQAAVLPPEAVEKHAPARLESVSAATATFLKPVTVQGKVTFYKKSVKGAALVLAGETQKFEVKTDADGLFKFEAVPGGVYTLSTSIIIKNKIRDDSRTVTVPLTAEQPIDVAIDLQ